MAATYARLSHVKFPEGKRHFRTVTMTGDSSYPTGGYTYTANQFGFDRIENIIPSAKTLNGSSIYEIVWDPTGGKIQVWVGTTGATAQVASTTDISAITLTFNIIGV